MSRQSKAGRINWFEQFLRRINACKEGREWAEGMTIRQAWGRCANVYWMMWLIDLIQADKTAFLVADVNRKIRPSMKNLNYSPSLCNEIRAAVSAPMIDKLAHQYERDILRLF